MTVKSCSVTNFRNFTKSTFYFNPFLTIIIGINSVGKTNILEALHYSLTTKGFRDDKQEELIHFEKMMCSVKTTCSKDDDIIIFTISIKKNGALEKTMQINRIKKTRYEYTQYTPPVVLFSPQIINIIEGSPSSRRRYVDSIISTYDREYKKRLNNYENALIKRNKILERKISLPQLKEELAFWDDYLEKQAAYVGEKRSFFTKYLNKHENIKQYGFKVKYIKNLLNKALLEKTLEQQLRFKTTFIGPQRDDYIFYKKDGDSYVNMQKFGSRSEERLTLFWLIKNQLTLFEEQMKQKPILLLDDIFSELDILNKSVILDLIANYQTILTTTEIGIIDYINIPHSIIKLK